MKIDVFGLPTSFNRVSVTVTLWDLSHDHSADISLLLVSPLGKEIMLMSNVGGNSGVSDATLAFRQWEPPPVQADPIPSGDATVFGPSNYGQVSQMPQVGTDPPPTNSVPYSINLNDVQYDNPNGRWKLYIYDWYNNAHGHLYGSWEVGFTFQ